MVQEPDFFLTYILPVLLGFLGSLPGLGSLLVIILRNKAETKKLEGEALVHFEAVASNAAKIVLEKDSRIASLEGAIDEFREKFRSLEDTMKEQEEKIETLEKENRVLRRERDERARVNQTLSNEISNLKDRVRILEEILRENNIPIPKTALRSSE